MTLFERFNPQDVPVLLVDTARPNKNGVVSIRLPAFKGRPELTYQNLEHLQQRAAAIRSMLAGQQKTKDRGS